MKAPLLFIYFFLFLFQPDVYGIDRIEIGPVLVNDSSNVQEDSVKAQIKLFENSPVPDKSRTRLLMCTTIGLYPVSMYWLYTQWYQDYPQSGFHFFNDNAEWEKMDKFGHAWDA